MAFSTQKKFFNLHALSDANEPLYNRVCVNLKTYASTTDERSWSLDETTQSRFLTELVTAKPSDTNSVCEGRLCTRADSGGGCKIARNSGGEQKNCFSDLWSALRGTTTKDTTTVHLGETGDNAFNKCMPSVSTGICNSNQSVKTVFMEYALENWSQLQELLKQKKPLVCNKSSKEYNRIIKLLEECYGGNFLNKLIQLLIGILNEEQLNANEERELKEYYYRIENMSKVFDLIIENNSCIINHLQPKSNNEIKELKEEIRQLHEEISHFKEREDFNIKSNHLERQRSSQNDENYRNVMKKCSDMHKRCKSYDDMESTVIKLQQKMQKDRAKMNNLNKTASEQAMYIEDLEEKLHNMQLHYQNKIESYICNENILRHQLCSMKESLVAAKCQANENEIVINDNKNLINEIKNLEYALSQYDTQYQQMMCFIESLRNSTTENSVNSHIEDLCYYTTSTLTEIKKNLERRNQVGDSNCIGKCKDNYTEGKTMIHYDVNKVTEETESIMKILKLSEEKSQLERFVEDMKSDCEQICANAINKLYELHIENEKLRKFQNDILCENRRKKGLFMLHKQKVDELMKSVDNFESEFECIKKNENDLKNEINNSQCVIEEINYMQEINHKLCNEIDTLYTLDEVLLNDLTKQLCEAVDSNKIMQLQNQNLKKRLTEYERKICNERLENEEREKCMNISGNMTNENTNDLHNISNLTITEDTIQTIVIESTTLEVESTTKPLVSSRKSIQTRSVSTQVENTENVSYNSTRYSSEIGTGLGSSGKHVKSKKLERKDENLFNKDNKTYEVLKQVGLKTMANGNSSNKHNTEDDLRYKHKSNENYLIQSEQNGKQLMEKSTENSVTQSILHLIKQVAEYQPQSQKNAILVNRCLAERSPPSGASAKNLSSQLCCNDMKDQLCTKNKLGMGDSNTFYEFVHKHAQKLSESVSNGTSFVTALSQILSCFVEECGFCSCKDSVPKSRFYSVCHKMLHRGVEKCGLSELVYTFKKLYKAIESVKPGYLLEHVLNDIIGIRKSMKCCKCKNIMCCTDSEENLKAKVYKLERDIELARDYLKSLQKGQSNLKAIKKDEMYIPLRKFSNYSLKPNVIKRIVKTYS